MPLFRRQPRRLTTGLLAAGLLGAGLGGGPPARGETLAQAVALVYDANPQLQAQRAQLRAVQEAENQALAGYGPTASLQIARTRTHSDARGVEAEATSNTDQLSVEQPLYSGGAAHAGLNLARAQVAAGREALLQSEQQILQGLVAAFSAVRRDEQAVAIARENVQVLEQQLADTEAKFALFEVTITDRSQAQARLAGARARLLARQGQLAQSRSDYLAVVGQNPGDLAPPPAAPNLPGAIEDAFSRAERNNHALRIAIYAQQQSQARLQLAKTPNRPTISLQVQSAATPLNSFNPIENARATTAAVVLRQIIPLNGAVRSRVAAAEAQAHRDQLLVDDARRQAIRSVSQAWNQLATARGTLSARREELEAQQVAYESVKEEQRLGLRTVLDVLNAEQELRDAKFNLIETAYQEYVSSTALLAAMGELRFVDFSPGLTPISVEPRRALRAPWTGLLDTLDSVGVRDPAPIEQTLGTSTRRPDGSLPLVAADGATP